MTAPVVHYQFAILRYRFSASIGEALNVGVVMWLPLQRELRFHVTARLQRLTRAYPSLEGTAYVSLRRAVKRHFKEVAERRGVQLVQRELVITDEVLSEFHGILAQLTEPDPNHFCWSEPRGGSTPDVETSWESLIQHYVDRLQSDSPPAARNETAIWDGAVKSFFEHGISFNEATHRSPYYERKFRATWQNGMTQYLDAISFDLAEADRIEDKANKWCGILYNLRDSSDFRFSAVIARPHRNKRALTRAFDLAVGRLQAADHVRRLVAEDQLESFIDEIRDEVLPNG